MRESRPYGSVRGARNETRVPTATDAVWSVAQRQPLLTAGFLTVLFRGLFQSDHGGAAARHPGGDTAAELAQAERQARRLLNRR
jgi:hypothetical protein